MQHKTTPGATEECRGTSAQTLYVTDLDGTLLHNDQSIGVAGKAALNELLAQGMLFTYATACSFTSASRVTQGVRFSLPVITYSGAMLVDPADGRVLEACVLAQEQTDALRRAVEAAGLCPLVYAFVEGTERVSWLRGREGAGVANYLHTRNGDKRLRPVADCAALFAGDVFYLTFIGTEAEMCEAQRRVTGIAGTASNLQEDTYTPGEFWMEAFRQDATKAYAALKVKQRVCAERLVCFGDNLNDLSMFGVADACYAVANAAAPLKEIATGIIAANEEDGVPERLRAFWAEK